MDRLLIEICTEEIPAGYIEPALNTFATQLLNRLADARIAHGNAGTYGTPRRLAVIVDDVSSKQKSVTTELIGPPEKVGFDAQGNPTLAAERFAEKVGVPVAGLKTKETPKGVYLCANRTERGRATKTILSSILPDLILTIPFPKTMRWSDLPIAFARPIQSVLALLGNRVVPFDLGKKKSTRYTPGHRFLYPNRLRISSPDQYVETLRNAYVLVDADERKKTIKRQIEQTAKKLNGSVLPDDDLVDIVNNLVEYPAAVAGRFDSQFLKLPDEVLITAMREHQKYFSIVDDNKRLMPFFIAVNNTQARDMALVAKGHERVLKARLKDAQFFFQSDLKVSFAERVEKLKGVLFQADLGSMHEKTVRIEKNAKFLVEAFEKNFGPNRSDRGLVNAVSRAAGLCKADLVSQVVVEFPKLQGIMGRIYAQKANETAEVAAAIEEHYQPVRSGGKLPETLVGSILAIADKIDSICGCFSVGLIPSGASDPYALRRQGIGIVQIILQKGFAFSLPDLIDQALSLFGDTGSQQMRSTAQSVYTFLQNRMVHLLAEEGYLRDVIAAVVSVSADYVHDVWNRVKALEHLKTLPDFEPLAVAFKRVVNIIKQAEKSEIENAARNVDESLFQHPSESKLFSDYQKVKQMVAEDLANGSFDKALINIASLRDAVDAFFEGVLVMSEDLRIRRNRLALLSHIAALFGGFADFSKIST